ncbi:MAG: hypothetical protein H2045_10955 [Rhizobiales bacterium]|nr:hypothetical protein [Hyphomicrobiales bacterium]
MASGIEATSSTPVTVSITGSSGTGSSGTGTNASAASTSATPSATSSLDTPAVIPPRDFAQEARDIARNFERANRAGERYQRFQPPEPPIVPGADPVALDPQEAARQAIRTFEDSASARERFAPSIASPAQRLLSVERQNVDILIAQRSTARNLSSFIGTLNQARADASSFYRGSGDSGDIRRPGTIFSNTI